MKAFVIINVLILILLVWSLIYKKENDVELLSMNNTNSLRGIFMLLMISHHICTNLENNEDILVRILATLGGMFTGIYFFLSGHGNYISYQRNSLNGFVWLCKRIFFIIIPFELCYPVISILSEIVRGGGGGGIDGDVGLTHWLWGAVTLTIPGATNWFIKVILVCYLLFFIIFYKIKMQEHLKLILLSTITLTYVFIAITMSVDNVWWSSILCFPLGVFYAANKKTINIILQKKSIVLICFALSLICYILFVKVSMVFHVFACLFGSFAVLILNEKARCDSKILRSFGSVSYEIYIIHSGFVAAIYTDTLNNIQVCNVYILSIIGAFVVHKITSRMFKICLLLISNTDRRPHFRS